MGIIHPHARSRGPSLRHLIGPNPGVMSGQNALTDGGWLWANNRPAIDGFGPFVVSAWLMDHLDNEANEWFQCGTSTGGTGSSRNGIQLRHQNSRDIRVIVKFTTTQGIWETNAALYPAELRGHWHHFVVMYDWQDDVTNDPRLFYNGVEHSLSETTTPVGSPDNVGSIDTMSWGGGTKNTSFNGSFADCALWRGEFLTPTEIALLAEGRVRPGDVRPENLRSWVDCATGVDVMQPHALVLNANTGGIAAPGLIPPKLARWAG